MTLSLTTLSSVLPHEVRWLWQGVLAYGKITLLAGDPGLGKSFVTLDLAARVSRGRPFPTHESRRTARGVLLISCEDDLADTIAPRLDAAEADRSVITHLDGKKRPDGRGVTPFDLSCPDDLEAAIRDTPDCALVIIDPLNAYLGGTDSHKAAEVRGLLSPIAEVAKRQSVAILIVHHLNKGDSTNPLSRIAGSGSISATARMVYTISADPDQRDRRLVLPAKVNIAKDSTGFAYRIEDDPARVVWEPEPVQRRAVEAFSGVPRVTSRAGTAREYLKTELSREGRFYDELIAGAPEGVSGRVLSEAANAVGVMRAQRGFGREKRSYWTLPGPAQRAGPSPRDP